MKDPEAQQFPRAVTGIEGLDSILGGGFPANRMYLIEGDPGAGKTTLALQFLLAGAREGQPGVYAIHVAEPLMHDRTAGQESRLA